jgi:hypothetical protein
MKSAAFLLDSLPPLLGRGGPGFNGLIRIRSDTTGGCISGSRTPLIFDRPMCFLGLTGAYSIG